MSLKCRILLILVTFSMVISLGNVTLAQTVDPCQYGCPKDGCPQCPDDGGPIDTKAVSDNAIMQLCKEENRIGVKLCNYPEKEPQELRKCLADVRNKFDACMQASGK